MKKITFYLIMLLSVTAFSQIEIIENFDDDQVPANWTANSFATNSIVACGGTGSGLFKLLNGGANETATTASTISNGTNLTASFSYNVFAYAGTASAPTAGWGSIVAEYSTDGGTNWTNITTIDDSNFTFSGQHTCGATGDISLGVIANALSFEVRFVATNSSSGSLVMVIDEVSFAQEVTTVPNCDSVLTTPLAGSNTADLTTIMTWSAATGFATDYMVSVGTTSGATDIVNATTTGGATSYDLSNASLTYTTDYYVTITPINSFGNATGCSEEMFTTRTQPIDGATCGSPITVSSFPYLAANDTNNFEDNIDTSPCNNSYMSGKDVFYEITPTTDVSININVTNIIPASGSRASIHVVEGCPDTATNCVDYVGAYSAPSGGVADERSLTDVVLSAGVTYFIVLSTSNNSATFSYNLYISQNNCINPTMEFTPVSDCGNAQFTVDVDVTYTGDASSLTLTDDFSNTYNVTSTGVVNAGPYASGSTVNFTLTNDQDTSCSFNDSTFFFCPPTNDDCATPITLTANTDDTCTMLTSATNTGATESTGFTTSCTGGDTNDVWFSFVATASNMFIEYSNKTLDAGSGNILKSELFSGNCGALTSLACYGTDYASMEGLTIGDTYYLRNYSNSTGAMISFDVCLSNYPATPANDECIDAIALTLSSDSSCGSATASTLAGALNSTEGGCQYGDVWFSYTPTADGVFEIVGTGIARMMIFEGTCATGLTLLTTAGGNSCNENITNTRYMELTGGETYYIMVRNYSSSAAGADITVCIYELSAPSNNDCSDATAITLSDDMGNNAVSGDLTAALYSSELSSCTTSTTYESIWYSFTATTTGLHHFVFNDTGYSVRYAVYNTGDCASMDTASLLPGQETYCTSNDENFSATLTSGQTYLISVFASSSSNTDYELYVYQDASLSTADLNFETFKYYPNPVKNTLTVEAKNTISTISIHNIVGQQVKTLTPNDLNTTINMNQLDNGIYFVTVTINNTQKTFKVIKK